jgi:hypothetical protein
MKIESAYAKVVHDPQSLVRKAQRPTLKRRQKITPDEPIVKRSRKTRLWLSSEPTPSNKAPI